MSLLFLWDGHKSQIHHCCVSLWYPLDGLIPMGLLLSPQSSSGEGRSAALKRNMVFLTEVTVEQGQDPFFLLGLQLLAESLPSVLLTLSK